MLQYVWARKEYIHLSMDCSLGPSKAFPLLSVLLSSVLLRSWRDPGSIVSIVGTEGDDTEDGWMRNSCIFWVASATPCFCRILKGILRGEPVVFEEWR